MGATDTERVRTVRRPMKRNHFAIAAILCLMAPYHALAEPTSTDQKIQERAAQKPDLGLVFMEVRLFRQGEKTPQICQSLWVNLAPKHGRPTRVMTQSSPTLFGHASADSTYGGWAVLDEETYIVHSIECNFAGQTYRGPFAAFALRKGEVLNLGRLVIEYKLAPPEFHLLPYHPKNTGVWIVEDLSPEAVASLTKAAPAAFAKATKHYMSIVVVKPKPPAAAPN